MSYKIVIADDIICELQKELGAKTWSEFMQHDCIVNKYWNGLYRDFQQFQFGLFDGKEIVGVGNTLYLNWQKPFAELPEEGMDWAFEQANSDLETRLKPNLLVGVQILINNKYQGHGVSYEMLEGMKYVAKINGIENIAIPLRPTLKSNYPLIPVNDYINWKNKDGLPFDPWLRVHIKAGGTIAGICNKSMYIKGSVVEWEKWTNMKFPGSGDYIVDKALVPVHINKEEDIGEYIEPNIWIIHKIK